MAFIIPTGKEKSQFVKGKFSVIAKHYDLFNDLITQGMHRYWKNFLVEKSRLKGGDTVLDICCGTGDITQRLKVCVGENGDAIGLDFSSGMLDIAKGRNVESGINFLQADAMNLPFQDNSMDVITVGFGLRNLIDITKCLSEVIRVLKPGGRFLCLDMGKIKIPILKQLFNFYFFRIVPVIGKLMYPGEDLFDYFPASSLEYPSQEKLAGMLLNIGFEEVEFFNFYFGSTTIHYAEKPKI
ncbi:MAG: bifunctional demethylmenaquinone methyltransferase/2-methoxy-6-polyprenyl-1,4-benzoquinol methylase UbiE [Deltaproteobacteria bacterium]|nr:bifunctional demethylmenaquinone methyltransferase/2-methoxy-6-polyprenyl-1,4-benzoquinol methylase UbiE [Deltaproteobacteria bacterium]